MTLVCRHSIPAGGFSLVLADPQTLRVSVPEVVLPGGKALRGSEAKKTDRLGGILFDTLAAFAQHAEVILAARIAGVCFGLAGSIGGGAVAAPLRRFGGSKICGSRPNCRDEENEGKEIWHRAYRVLPRF